MMTIGNINSSEESIILSGKDGINIKIPIDVAKISITIKNMLEDLGEMVEEGEENIIPITNINGAILAKIFQFCNYIHTNQEEFENLKTWLEDKSFSFSLSQWFNDYLDVEQELMFQVILGANFLDIQPLLNMQCKHVANIIRNKTPAELKVLFATPTEADVPQTEATEATEAVDATS